MRLKISMQPTSISRSPFFGSRPVVSVSRTISRIMSLSPGYQSATPQTLVSVAADRLQFSDDRIDLGVAVFAGAGGVHNEIGARALFRLRNLPRHDSFEFGLRHSGPLKGASALDVARGANDGPGIERTIATGVAHAP